MKKSHLMGHIYYLHFLLHHLQEKKEHRIYYNTMNYIYDDKISIEIPEDKEKYLSSNL